MRNSRKGRRHSALSAIDIAICRCLSRDARMPVSNIASELGIAESTVRGRLNRLVSEGIVQFAAVIDPINLGYSVWVWIGLQVELSRTRKVAKQLADIPEIYFVGIATGGEFEIVLSAIFRSTDELGEFLMDRLPRIKGILKSSTYQYISFTKRELNLPPLPNEQFKRSSRARTSIYSSRDKPARRTSKRLKASSPSTPG